MRIKGLARSKSNETNILCQIQDFQAALGNWKLKILNSKSLCQPPNPECKMILKTLTNML